jgi:hypothetical protein
VEERNYSRSNEVSVIVVELFLKKENQNQNQNSTAKSGGMEGVRQG